MIKNYLKVALRKIGQHKLHSFINIGGLAIGIACFLLIVEYVDREMNYDNFHKDKKNIYRFYRIENEPSGKVTSAAVPHALRKALINDYPELKNVVSILSSMEDEIKSGKNIFKEKILFSSPNFFDMFDFQFKVGNYKQLNENINSILLTQRLANKLFGNDSPLGKTVTVHGQFPFTVSGIIEDIPGNSNFQFDAFVSSDVVYHYILPEEESKWYSMGVETFVEFSPKLSPEHLQAQLPEFLKKYLPDFLQGRLELGLQPLNDIHTNNEIESFLFPPISKTSLLMFFVIACTILGISSINFINLTSYRYTERKKEIGMRKVVGAKRIQLIYQFLSESVLMTFCALIIGYSLIGLMLPYFNKYIQHPLTLDTFNDSTFFLFAVLFALMLGVINGLYPAILLSAFKPVIILRNESQSIFGKIRLRHLFITLQFVITIILIFGVISIFKQISFMKNHELGFLSENLIAIPTNTHPTEKPDKDKIKLFTELTRTEGQNHGIISAAFSENVPGSYFPNFFSIIPDGSSEENKTEMVITRAVDENFFNTYKMKIIKGRNFSEEMATDFNTAAIINETAAKMLGWSDPIGRQFRFAFDQQLFTVIGVVNDFHFRSLQNKIEPLVFLQCWGNKNFVTARVRSDDIQKSIAYIRQEWNKIMPSFPFEYHFVKDMYKESYKEEEKLFQAISSFAVLAMILSSLGMLGLIAVIVIKRTKEIGIRKILGASIFNLVFIMSKELMLSILAANIFALPAAVYFINNWLQNFPYRTDINWWVFMSAGGIAVIIVLVTISFHSIKTALANPVESLRYE
jgi:putative ABC transport system permease protein